MSDQVRCRCQRCTIRSLKGPVIIVTIGLLFLLSELRGGYFDFSNTWPVILVVIGLLSLASAFASPEGHVVPAPPVMQSIQSVPTPPPPAPTSYPGQGQ